METPEGAGFIIRTNSQGLAPGEVISITEAWLEKAKREHREELGFDF